MDAQRKPQVIGRAVALSLLCAGMLMAQDTQSTTTSQSGQASVETEVHSGQVVYVSGNDVVMKMDNGELNHFNVPDSFHFDIDGKDMTVRDLTPGMRLSCTITTTTTPKTIQTVRNVNGTVWSVNPPKTLSGG